jgi:hypothetical protein
MEAVVMALFLGGFEGGIIVVLFLFPMQWFKGNVLIPGIVGSCVGVHPLLVLFATLHVPTLFERWQRLPVVEAVVEKASGVAASGEEFVGLRGSVGREG